MISESVGVAGANRSADVKQVQQLLNGFAARLQIQPLAEDGDCGPATRAAIKAFQQDVVGMDIPDGRIDPGGRTWTSLTAAPSPGSGDTPLPTGDALTTLLTPGPRTPLRPADFATAAASLDCDVAAIQAVAKVESARAAFDDLGRPTILYERHLFRRFTKGKFDNRPDLSNPEAGGYGKFSEQYGKLQRAYKLDEEAALKACSWGMFQILGSNHRAAGFETVSPYVKAMCQTELDQLNAFVSFIRNNAGMHAGLRQHDWETFARLYNGPAFHKNRYDERMADAHRQLSGGH
jgi:peptidoglycan hydrolase-like protein with peptidoglycan-binding domain